MSRKHLIVVHMYGTLKLRWNQSNCASKLRNIWMRKKGNQATHLFKFLFCSNFETFQTTNRRAISVKPIPSRWGNVEMAKRKRKTPMDFVFLFYLPILLHRTWFNLRWICCVSPINSWPPRNNWIPTESVLTIHRVALQVKLAEKNENWILLYDYSVGVVVLGEYGEAERRCAPCHRSDRGPQERGAQRD